ncbi:MAG: hypothetical protein ACUVTO_02435 [Candidatus Caldatribacteriaceae bacterium]
MKACVPWRKTFPFLGIVREKARIVFARNLAGIPFPSSPFFRPLWSEEVKRRAFEVLLKGGKSWRFALVEEENGVSLFVREKRGQRLGILVNGEDHLRLFVERMSSLRWSDFETLRRLDQWLERSLDYAFDPQWGYLTASLCWTGTGLRAYLWLHLPALSIAYGEDHVFQWFRERQEFIVSGYGGNREPMAHVFEITNRYTLGVTEKEILESMLWIERKVTRWEKSIRDVLRTSSLHRQTLLEKLQETGKDLEKEGDKKDKRMLDFLSLLRFGQEEGIFDERWGCNRVDIGGWVQESLKASPLRGVCEDILEFLGVPLGRIRDDV